MAQATAARIVAFHLLSEQRQRNARARDLIRNSDDVERLGSTDRGQVMRLVLGTVAARGTLDELLDRHLHHPQRLQPRLRDVMRMEAFELCYLGTRPDVAVSQGVELAKQVNTHAAGLVNAVLRRVAEEDAPRVREACGRVASGSCEAADLGFAGALPEWIVEQVISDRGPAAAAAFAEGELAGGAPVWVAVNHVKHDRAEAERLLAQAGLKPEATAFPSCFMLAHPAGLSSSGLVHHADVIPADLAAQAVAVIVAPRENERVLEVGQGRGTKTLLLENDSIVHGGPCLLTGIDDEASRIEISTVRMRRAGLSEHVACRLCDARDIAAQDTPLPHAASGLFDVAFVDAPCSGTGTLRRHPEIAWNLSAGDVDALAKLQLEILSSTASCVRPGGRLVYSTCSILRQEDEDVVKAFLASEAGQDFSVGDPCARVDASIAEALRPHVGADGFFQTLPSEGSCDGHFCAVLERQE